MQINNLDDFIQLIPKDTTSVKKKVRCLYLELGKRSFYDIRYKYFMYEEEEQQLIYKRKIYENPNIIICTTLAKQLVELLGKVEITADLVQEDRHYLVKFWDEQANSHFVDLTNDLKNIQFGCKTQYFGKDTIPFEELRQMDIELGYITSSKGYSDENWHILRDILKISHLSDKKKLELIIQNMQKFGDISKPRRCRDILYVSKIY